MPSARAAIRWRIRMPIGTCSPATRPASHEFSGRTKAPPADARAYAFIEMRDEGEKLPLTAKANAQVTWLSRGGADAAPRRIVFPAGEGFHVPQGRGQAYALG